MSSDAIARAWLYAGAVALLASGVLSAPMLLGKIPLLQDMLPPVEWIRWALVIHVILSLLVWFMSIPVAITQQIFPTIATPTQKILQFVSALGLLVMVLGVFLMITTFLKPGVVPVLSNYLPVITDRRFGTGLTMALFGLVIGFLAPLPYVFSKRERRVNLCPPLRFGILVGASFFILSLSHFTKSYFQSGESLLKGEYSAFEPLMWGGGHLLQHSSAVFLVCAWTVLLQRSQKVELRPWILWSVFSLFALPLLPALILLGYDFNSIPYRFGFTSLMQWGIFPAVLLYLLYLLVFFWHQRRSFRFSVRWVDPIYAAISLSALLMTVGFLFGASIRGADLRIPAHYHATIGGITLAFMFYVLVQLSGNHLRTSLMRLLVFTYAIGQLLFSSGLFIAGSFGVERKTYGAEVVLTHVGQKVGFAVLAVGGVGAFVGGVLFAVVFFRSCCCAK